MKEWIYSNENHSTIINEKNGVVFITFPKLVKAGVKHGYCTRIGGVSKGHLGSMNLSFHRGDDPENVYENFKRLADAVGFCQDDLVFAKQVHKTEIHVVSGEDKGKGILKPELPGIDGMVTTEKGIPMFISAADCVPILFYDPVLKVAAVAHSGWRGTAAGIGAKMVAFMGEKYHCKPENIIAAIGPSICKKCYEVSEDVAIEFRKTYPAEEVELFLEEKGGGKYQLDLWKANELLLYRGGILPEHLDVTDLCTCCNSDQLFSHRKTKGHRGNLGAVMMLD